MSKILIEDKEEYQMIKVIEYYYKDCNEDIVTLCSIVSKNFINLDSSIYSYFLGKTYFVLQCLNNGYELKKDRFICLKLSLVIDDLTNNEELVIKILGKDIFNNLNSLEYSHARISDLNPQPLTEDEIKAFDIKNCTDFWKYAIKTKGGD